MRSNYGQSGQEQRRRLEQEVGRMTKAALTFLLAACVCQASAEFYVWTDSVGVRRVSTHPPECFTGSDQPLRKCAPIQANPELKRWYALKQEAKDAENRAIAFAKECAALKSKRDRLSTAVRDSQRDFNSKVVAGLSGGGVMNMNVQEIINAPLNTRRLWEEMLAADKAYDKCVPESERPARKGARNAMRRQTAENARAAQQQNLLRNIQNNLNSIKQEIGVP